jgi:hypothetical protein
MREDSRVRDPFPRRDRLSAAPQGAPPCLVVSPDPCGLLRVPSSAGRSGLAPPACPTSSLRTSRRSCRSRRRTRKTPTSRFSWAWHDSRPATTRPPERRFWRLSRPGTSPEARVCIWDSPKRNSRTGPRPAPRTTGTSWLGSRHRSARRCGTGCLPVALSRACTLFRGYDGRPTSAGADLSILAGGEPP